MTKVQNKASIGALLLDAGKINLHDAELVIALQKKENIRFGDAAKKLGLVTDDDIQKVISKQFNFEFLTVNEKDFDPELIAAYNPFSPQVEALRALRGQLMLRWSSETNKTLVLVSPNRNEGRSTLAANLAIIFSQLGERTLLIDADLQQPRQHTLFKLKDVNDDSDKDNRDYGLSDILVGRADLTIIRRIHGFKDLSILQAGTVPPNPVELISKGLKDCLKQLETQFDIILIDSPAAEQSTCAQIIASNCNGVLLVARQNETRLNDLLRLKTVLQDTGCQCVGVALTDFLNVKTATLSG